MHLKLGGKLPIFKGKSAKVPGERPGYLVTYPSYTYTSAAEHNDMTVIDSQPYAINYISRWKILYWAMQSFWSNQKSIWSLRCRVIACVKGGSTQTWTYQRSAALRVHINVGDKRWTGCTLVDIRFSVSSDLMISVLACHPPFSAIEPANPKGGLEVISRQLRSAKGTNGRWVSSAVIRWSSHLRHPLIYSPV